MGEPKKILALDLATVVGWALGHLRDAPPPTDLEAATAPPTALRSGHQRIGTPLDDDGRFFADYEAWLLGMIAVLQPDIIVFEAPILWAGHTSVQTARRLMTLAGLTDKIAHQRSIRRFEANVQDIKRHATGNGRAKKHEMVAAARARRWTPHDDNEADALWLLDYAIARLGGGARAEAAARRIA